MKRPSEGLFGEALRDVDLVKVVYRLPDPKGGEGVSNWKPCDWMAWTSGQDRYGPGYIVRPAWFECKDVDAVKAFPLRDVRPSQWQGMHDARKVGIPYWLAVWWRRQREWTISDAGKLLGYVERWQSTYPAPGPTSIDRDNLIGLGIQSTQHQLTSTLKALLLGELG